MGLLAYQNNPENKRLLLAHLNALAEQGKLETRPIFWDGSVGSVVGSAVCSDDLDRWESELGLPKWMALCIDGMANWMRGERSGLAAGIALLGAISPGADVSLAGSDFLIYLLTDPSDGLTTICSQDEQLKMIARLASLHQRCFEGGQTTRSDWSDVRAAATASRNMVESGSVHDLIGAAIEAAAWNPLASRSAVSDTQCQWVWAMSFVANRDHRPGEDAHIRLVLGQLYEKAKLTSGDAHVDVFALLEKQDPELWEVVKARNVFQAEQPLLAWRRLERALLRLLKEK